jgi:5'-3' exonuclease
MAYDTRDEIITFVITKLDTLMADIKPSGITYIAFDGVAPVAKLEQQRSRRFKKRYDLPDKVKEFNTIEITPGTLFSKMVDTRIHEYYQNISNVIVSGFFNAGEGEHKIMDYMRNNQHILMNATNAIYGLDADLIMLALNISNTIPHIFLLRETPHFVSYVDKTLEPNALYLLDIAQFELQLQKETNCSAKDYIFVCFLLGNDFMPHFPSINIRTGGIVKLMDTFTHIQDIINPTTHKIDWVKFKQYILYLAVNEKQYIQNELRLRDETQRNYYPSRTPEEVKLKLNMIPTYERELEKKINPDKPNWEKRYYSLLFNVHIDKVTPTFIKKVCMEYLYGLEWTYKYYSGPCPDWRWMYPYYYPPLLMDLINYVPEDPEYEFISEEHSINSLPIDPIVQLCYVLPIEYFNLLPSYISKRLLSKYKKWYVPVDEEPDFLWAFCKYFWESHIILPEIPVNKLEKVYYDSYNKHLDKKTK